MNDYLVEAAEGNPVFAPHYYSISEFFQKHSRYTLADHIQLVSILHKSYCRITGEKQTLDQFYAWGEILLADFDNVDKSLADAEQLFHNISNIHIYDSIDYLTEHQKELLEHFFHSFTRNHESVIQQKFIALWNNLLDIYSDFKSQLTSLGLAYEGMLYRDVVENIGYEDFPLEAYYIVGFNQLLKCEEKLLLILSDKLRIQNDEASIHTVNPEAKITIAQSLTDDLQARFIENWLKENNRITAGRKTAIVLCDEHMLPSAVYGLPNNVGPVNITAGFPVTESQPASYISTLLELYTDGISKDGKRFRTSFLRNLQGHPLYKYAIPIAENDVVQQKSSVILSHLEQAITAIAIGTADGDSTADQMLHEATFRVHNIITRLKTLSEQDMLDIEPVTLARLYKQIILTATIPFHGEPAKGIQVMGVLETRNLDFDHILMLSCNEGSMPKGESDTSVIPYAIKKAFSLSTSDDRTNIFAYYFYRLLKRCKDVTLVFNASSSDTSPGEMSRFLLNLIVNNSKQINRISLQTDFLSKTAQPRPVEITNEELNSYIEKRKEQGISPSAINTFFRCQKMFYYQYYRNLREENDEEDTMDDAAFGTFFHNAAEDFYHQFVGTTITTSQLEKYIKNPDLLMPHINRALVKTQHELYGENTFIETSGMEHLLKTIVEKNLHRLIVNDQKFCPFSIVSLEQKYYKTYTVDTPFGNATVRVGGAVDRLDMVNDGTQQIIRVVDYKTGADHSDIGKVPSKQTEKENNTRILSVADIFNNKISGSNYYRQTCLYSIAISENSVVNPKHLAVAPALYYMRNKAIGVKDDKYDAIIKINGSPLTDISTVKAEYEAELQKVLHQIFTTFTFDVPEDITTCKNCPYAELCMN